MGVLLKIRVEIDAVDCEDDSYLLYDRSGLSKAQLVVSAQVIYVISLLDGSRSELDLQEVIERETGVRAQIGEIEEIINNLAAALFLDDANFRDYYENLQSEFFSSPVRKMVCAGSAYINDKDILSNDLSLMISQAPKAAEEGRITNAARPAPKGVIVPHMDFSRAAQGYGQVYAELKKYSPPEAVLIIGTAHQALKNRFAICNKDFAIPPGTVKVHQEYTQELISRCENEIDLCGDMFAHRFEHSIELQAVWLHHIWQNQVKIIPLLAGSVDDYYSRPDEIAHDRQICALVNAVRDMLAGRKIMVMASVDLAHIGKRFGDSREIDDEFLAQTREADFEYLEYVKAGDGLGAFRNLSGHNDSYHVCGTSSIYLLNSVLAGVSGRMLGYYQCVTEQLKQAVTCASVIYEY